MAPNEQKHLQIVEFLRIATGTHQDVPYFQNYTHDMLNRLKTVVSDGGWRQTYVYDKYGNRALLSGTVDGNWVPQDGLTPQVATDEETAVEAIYGGNRLAAANPDSRGNLELLKGTAYPAVVRKNSIRRYAASFSSRYS